MKMMGRKCSHCGSTEVTHDALVRWNNAAQEWENSSTLDSNDCDACGNDNCVVEYELRGQELADAMHERRLCGADELLAILRGLLKDDGPVAQLVIPGMIADVQAIRVRLREYAATMAEQDKLVDALALTLPYAETRAADLLDAKLNNEPEYGPGFIEDESCPGADEAASVVEYAGKVLAEHGTKSRLLERGERAGGAA